MMAKQKTDNKKTAPFYRDNYGHLEDELRKLDLLIQLRVTAFRLKTQAMQKAAASQQMYICHDEVDWLLSRNEFLASDNAALQKIRKQIEILQSEINTMVTQSLERGLFLALPHLAHIFGLSPFEVQLVIICLAPELQRKYDRLYAYLQDDITRKKPSVDLVLDLLCDTEADRWTARTLFSEHAPLFRSEILHMADDPQSPSGSSDLARFLKLDQRIAGFLLGNNSIDGRLDGIAQLYQPIKKMDQVPVDSMIKTRLLNLTKHHFSDQKDLKGNRKGLVLHFCGPYGVGKRDLALGICGQLNCPLLCLDMELLLGNKSDLETVLRLVFREGLLLQAAIYLNNVVGLLEVDDKAKALQKKMAKVIAVYGWLTFLAGEKPWAPKGVFEHLMFQAVQLPVPDVPLRETAWKKGMENLAPLTEITWNGQLASQFRLTPGQIRDAVDFLANRLAMSDGQKEITLADLYAACRNQSNQKLEELAIKIEPHYKWEDIVLPEDKVAQLKEICNQVKHRYRVFGEWGFDQKLSYGKGLSVLFSGPPGTGKTMAAEVIAHELQLDLYKIDLSGVVSKYIGETEKNLSKIFHEAETSNAILFFDEADALFGKRTQVSDAHDRYANIETSYLLQKMEEYEGVVILATNLRENMDEAFTRRIRFIVEFPFPDTASRLEIWKTHFPQEAPVSDGIDYEFLSKQFQIAGGNIKNIVLNSAFLAAGNSGIIDMEHILNSTKREFEKIGKLWNEKNFMRPDIRT
jgi:ATP-dependent 26S proteasome regulatory subunit